MKKILLLEISILILVGSYMCRQFIKCHQNNRRQVTEPVKVEVPNSVHKAQADLKRVENLLQAPMTGQIDREEVLQEIVQEEVKSALMGKIICIDAGHQSKGNSNQEPIGPGSLETKAKVSSGTRGVATGKYEYALNLEVALKLKAALLEKGATVYMVRETNEVDISNKERAELANAVGADLSLRIHADGSENSSAHGFSILVPGGSFVTEEVIVESYAVAEYINEYLIQGIENTSRGIITRKDLSGFNWSKVPAVLVEMGFMSNPEEDQRMNTKAFQDNLVSALVDAIEAYFANA